jgi:hypothetical protein
MSYVTQEQKGSQKEEIPRKTSVSPVRTAEEETQTEENDSPYRRYPHPKRHLSTFL